MGEALRGLVLVFFAPCYTYMAVQGFHFNAFGILVKLSLWPDERGDISHG